MKPFVGWADFIDRAARGELDMAESPEAKAAEELYPAVYSCSCEDCVLELACSHGRDKIPHDKRCRATVERIIAKRNAEHFLPLIQTILAECCRCDCTSDPEPCEYCKARGLLMAEKERLEAAKEDRT